MGVLKDLRDASLVHSILNEKTGLRLLMELSSSPEESYERLRKTAIRRMAMGEKTLVITFPLYSQSDIEAYDKNEFLVYLEFRMKEGGDYESPKISGPHEVGSVNVVRGFSKVIEAEEHVEIRIPKLEQIPYHTFHAIMEGSWENKSGR